MNEVRSAGETAVERRGGRVRNVAFIIHLRNEESVLQSDRLITHFPRRRGRGASHYPDGGEQAA